MVLSQFTERNDKMANPKVALIMGSDSDFDKVKGCITKLKNSI